MHSLDLILTIPGGLAGALVFGYLTQHAGLLPIVGASGDPAHRRSIRGEGAPPPVAQRVEAALRAIVIGCGPTGRTVTRLLRESGSAYVPSCARDERAPP